MSNVLLGVNIDHIATLRNARNTFYPDPVQAAFIAEQAGADSITIHLREDRRHITERDIFLLRQTIQRSMNLEISMAEDMIAIACDLKPNSCCLVPENRNEITTESGLDVLSNQNKLGKIIPQLVSVGIEVSVFLDTNKKQIAAAVELGVSSVELHTGPYVSAKDNRVRTSEFERLRKCVEYAVSCGIKVNAGHGLDYYNVASVSKLPLYMLHIGHAIVSRSVFCGLFAAVKEMKKII